MSFESNIFWPSFTPVNCAVNGLPALKILELAKPFGSSFFNDIPIKKETKNLIVNQKVVKADQKNKVIFYLEDRMEICRDLLANQRLNIPVTHSKKMSGPDKDGFRTICPRKSTFKKTNY